MSDLTEEDLTYFVETTQTDIDNIDADLYGKYCLTSTTVYYLEYRKGELLGLLGRLKRSRERKRGRVETVKPPREGAA